MNSVQLFNAAKTIKELADNYQNGNPAVTDALRIAESETLIRAAELLALELERATCHA